jgi:hypothetical protein
MDNLIVYCRTWQVRNAACQYAKSDFAVDFTDSKLTCPAGVIMAFQPGKTSHFPSAPAQPPPMPALQHKPGRTQHPPITPSRLQIQITQLAA